MPSAGHGSPPFEQVVTEHGPLVWRVCRALLGPADAEDAWSETFLAAMRAYPRLPAQSNLAGWLVTIAHRKALDQIRARSRRPAPGADLEVADPRVADPRVSGAGAGWAESPAEASALERELREALQALPFKQRGAVVYRYLADLSYAEIAELLGCSEAAARRSASDGIARLRRTYSQGALR